MKNLIRHGLLAAAMGFMCSATSAVAVESVSGTASTFSSTTSTGVVNINFFKTRFGGIEGVSFSDSFTFSLPKTSDLSGFVGNLSFDGFTFENISGLQLTLFKSGSTVPIGSGNAFTVLTQPSGDYLGKITGTVSAGQFGGYTGNVTATVSPVPEPSTYLMMLAGLAVLAFAASRGAKITKWPNSLAA